MLKLAESIPVFAEGAQTQRFFEELGTFVGLVLQAQGFYALHVAGPSLFAPVLPNEFNHPISFAFFIWFKSIIVSPLIESPF